MRIRILPEAEADLARAADFYDAQAGSLGDYFIECLSGDIESLKVHAGVHERQHGLLRASSIAGKILTQLSLASAIDQRNESPRVPRVSTHAARLIPADFAVGCRVKPKPLTMSPM